MYVHTYIVRRVAKRFGFKVVDDQKDPVLFWSDCSMAIDKAVTLKPYQVLHTYIYFVLIGNNFSYIHYDR